MGVILFGLCALQGLSLFNDTERWYEFLANVRLNSSTHNCMFLIVNIFIVLLLIYFKSK